MKKLLFLAAVSAMLSASAESTDQYLYWMVGDEATLDGSQIASGTYQAMIKDVGNNKYLDLYANPDSGYYGNAFTFELGESMDTFAQLPASLSSTSTFMVELYNYVEGTAQGSWVGQATLTWNSGNVTTGKGGMGHVNPVSVTGFTAAPEPTSGMLLLIGVAGLALRRRKIRVA